jgi:hypothetical protein
MKGMKGMKAFLDYIRTLLKRTPLDQWSIPSSLSLYIELKKAFSLHTLHFLGVIKDLCVKAYFEAFILACKSEGYV